MWVYGKNARGVRVFFNSNASPVVDFNRVGRRLTAIVTIAVDSDFERCEVLIDRQAVALFEELVADDNVRLAFKKDKSSVWDAYLKTKERLTNES